MGPHSIQPNAENCTRTELRVAAKTARSQASYETMMAISALLEGISPDQVIRLYTITRASACILFWIVCAGGKPV